MLRSIRLRLNLYYGVVLLLLILAVYLFLGAGFREYLLGKVKKEMRVNVLFLDKYLQNVVLKKISLMPRFQPELSRALGNIKGRDFPYRITIILRNGLVLADSDSAEPGFFENHKYRVEIVNSVKRRFGSSIRYSTTFRRDMIYFAYYNGKYTLRIARLLDDVAEEMSTGNRFLFFFSLLLLAISFAVNFMIAWHISRPMREITNFIGGYQEGNLALRMSVRRSDEIGVLQESMNDMADRIEQLVFRIRSEKERLENVIATVGEALTLISSQGEITLANEVFLSLFPDATTSVARPYYEVIDSPALNSGIESVLKSRQSLIAHVELLRLEEAHFEATLLPVKQDGSLLLIMRDVTEAKKYSRMKSEFFANASHELKTPLSIVGGYVESLMDQPEPGEAVRRDFLNRIAANVDRLSSLVKDITTLTRLEDGAGYFEHVKLDLREIVDGVVMSLRYKAQGADVEIKSELLDKAPYKGNSGLLESLIFNLVDNAINYNKQGGDVVVSLELTDGSYCVKVQDSGDGFVPELGERIFERFYRVDVGRSRNKGGTGLGLSIVKHAVRLHGGTITASSAGPGQGALFTVFLPLNAE